MKSLLKYFLLSSALLLGGCNHLASIKSLGSVKPQQFLFAKSDLSFFINTPCDPKNDFFEIGATEIEEKEDKLNPSYLANDNYSLSFSFELFECHLNNDHSKSNLPLYRCIPYNPSCKYLFLRVFRL